MIPESVGPGLSEFGVSVRVYRALGAQLIDFLNDSLVLDIRGPLLPGAYVQWSHVIDPLQVVFDDQNLGWSFAGDAVFHRHSNLHRTDQPCANLPRDPKDVLSYGGIGYDVTFLDALPFLLADIARHRSRLCDYCFYGGPAGICPSL